LPVIINLRLIPITVLLTKITDLGKKSPDEVNDLYFCLVSN